MVEDGTQIYEEKEEEEEEEAYNATCKLLIHGLSKQLVSVEKYAENGITFCARSNT